MYKKMHRLLLKSEDNPVLGRKPHFIFSAENPLYDKKLNMSHDEVVTFLRSKGYDVDEMDGHYGAPELSILVKNPTEESISHLHKLARDLGQESGIYSDGTNHEMHFYSGENAGKFVRGSGTNFHKKAPKDFYSLMSDGTLFTHNIDMNNWFTNRGFQKNEDDQYLEHYSPQQGLKTISPKFKGTGVDSGRRHNQQISTGISYFYPKGTEPERDVAARAKSKYSVKLSPEHKIYDPSKDESKTILEAKAQNQGVFNWDRVIDVLRNKGYHGSVVNMAGTPGVIMFDDLDVHEESPIKPFEIKKSELQKGAMKRIAPFNPKTDIYDDEADTIGLWQQNELQEYRKEMPEMDPHAKMRALNKLSAKTKTRKNPETGKRQFLLHRGMGQDEYRASRPNKKTISNPERTSWTPFANEAKEFAGKYAGPHVSAWVDEDRIYHVPSAYGAMDVDVPGKNQFIGEFEVVVDPHKSQIAEDQELFDPTDPKDIDEAINARGKMDGTWLARPEADKNFRSRLKYKKQFGKAEDDSFSIKPSKTNHHQGIRDIASAYAKAKDIQNYSHPTRKAQVNKDRAAKIAAAYHEMKHDPDHPDVKNAYQALINETMDQWNHIKQTGLKVSKIKPGMENPYKSSKDLFRDVRENNHMWYYPTEQGFGSQKDSQLKHPMLQATNEKHDGEPMVANDIFRIVHDYFGHAKEGYQFGPVGEENAWHEHRKMFTPLAQRALTAETRGQNSWVNFGPHGENNRKDPANTIYADQKAGLLPDWAYEHDEDDFTKNQKLEKLFVPVDDSFMKSKREVKHGDTVHLSHGELKPEGGYKVDTSKKYVARGKSKPGYRTSMWVVPHGEKDSRKGFYHRTDRMHHADDDVKKFEVIEKSIGPLKLSGLPDITTRPDQEIRQVGTQRQADIQRKVTEQKQRRANPANVGAVSEEITKPLQGLVQSFRDYTSTKNRQKAREKVTGKKLSPREQKRKDQITEMPTTSSGAHAFSIDLRESKEDPVTVAPTQLFGGPIAQHEAHHHMLGQVENKYGQAARMGIVEHLLRHVPEDTLNHIRGMMKDKYGYDPNHYKFNEEVFNHVHDILTHNPSREKYLKWGIPKDKHREVLGGLKAAWKNMRNEAKQITPQMLGKSESLQKSIGPIQLKGLKDITTRPDQQVMAVGSKRQADIARKTLEQQQRRANPEDKIQVEMTGSVMRPYLDKLRQSSQMYQGSKRRINQMEAELNLKGSKTPREMKVRDEAIGMPKTGVQGVNVGLYDSKERSRPFTAEQHFGQPVGQHEAHHHLFSEVGRKYGDKAKEQLINHLFDQIDPEMQDKIFGVLKQKGYRDKMKEEAINYLHDLTSHGPSRQDYFITHRLEDPQTQREVMSRAKSSWKNLRNAAKQVTSEMFKSELQKNMKGIRAGVLSAALGIASPSMAGEAPKPNQVINHDQHKKNSLNVEQALDAISQVESSGGKDLQHRTIASGMHEGMHSRSAYGLMPIVIKETIKTNKDLARKYGNLLNLEGEDFHNEYHKDPSLDRTIARKHLQRMQRHFGDNMAHIGMAWLNGITGAKRAIKNNADINNHWHVQKVLNAYKDLQNKQ